MHAEENKLQGIIKSLEKDIYGLKKEIQERDETIQDKVTVVTVLAWYFSELYCSHLARICELVANPKPGSFCDFTVSRTLNRPFLARLNTFLFFSFA